MDSYNTILGRMKDKYRELSGYDVPELSDIDIRMKVLAGEIYKNEVNLDFVKRQISPSTATGAYLDAHASDRGLSRKPAVKAKGLVRFYTEIPLQSDVSVPAGTVVATSGSQAVSYTTDSDITIARGSSGASAQCTAVIGGVSGNAAVGKVNVLVTNVIGVDGVTNLYPITGGTEEEGDDELRKRVIDSYKNISNGSNKVYYRNLALSVEGATSVNVVPNVRGAGTIDLYVASGRAAAPVSVVNAVSALVNSEREMNVSVYVFTADLKTFTIGINALKKIGYTDAAVEANIRASVDRLIDSVEVGDSVSQNMLGAAILSAEGVRDFSWLSGYNNQCAVDPEEIAGLSGFAINISEG